MACREALRLVTMLANRWIARSWPVGRRCGLLPCWQIGGLPGHGLSGGAEACYHAGKSVDCPVMACREALRPVTMLANRWIARSWPVGRRCGLLPCWQIGGLPGHGLSGGAAACYHAGKSVDCPVMACREALRPVTMLANRWIARSWPVGRR